VSRFAGLKRRRFKNMGRCNVSPSDTRSPMRRLLETGLTRASGSVEVEYDQQWRTFIKAQSLGYVEQHGSWWSLSEAGRAFLASDVK